jgi:hypothetical protein
MIRDSQIPDDKNIGDMILKNFGYMPYFIFKNRELFFFFVDECNKAYRHGDGLQYYRKIIEYHRQSNTMHVAKIVKQIYETLKKWNMNQRGAKLAPQDDFEKSLLSSEFKKPFTQLYKYKLTDLYCIKNWLHEFTIRLEKPLSLIFYKINVMESKSKIVGIAKTLHFLLPDLIIPIDRKYTMNFFYGHNVYSQNRMREFDLFIRIIMGTLLIAKRLDLKEGDVDGEGWNTSVPKLIDNAIIGVDHFFRRNFSKDIENATNNILSQMCNITHIQDSEKPEYKKLIEYELKKVEKEKEYVIREKEKIRQGKEWMKKIDEIYKTNPEKITELLESIRSKE